LDERPVIFGQRIHADFDGGLHSPAPYAGITRFRFDGFAADRRVSGPKDHPKDWSEV